MPNRDFTLETYKLLLNEIQNADYHFFSFENYVLNNSLPRKIVMLRHDVDRRPRNAFGMAMLENELGIKASYYFRIVKESYDEQSIKEIAAMGHEIGYHYEDLSLCHGNYELAIKNFEINLWKLRRFYPVKTLCMHGSPLSKWDNRLLWQEYNVKSTFFFLNESIKFNPFSISNWKLSVGRYNIESPKVVQIIQWLDKNGWEIGVHGSYNSYKNKELLLKEKKTLENIVGHEIIGVRQHYLNLNDQTWQLQQNCGFKYDSSFGYTASIGFKDNKITPFRPCQDNFIVFPLMIMDSCFMNTVNRWEKFSEIIQTVQRKDALLVMNWHQRVFNEKEFPEYKEIYIKIIEECRERHAQFYTLEGFWKTQ